MTFFAERYPGIEVKRVGSPHLFAAFISAR